MRPKEISSRSRDEVPRFQMHVSGCWIPQNRAATGTLWKLLGRSKRRGLKKRDLPWNAVLAQLRVLSHSVNGVAFRSGTSLYPVTYLTCKAAGWIQAILTSTQTWSFTSIIIFSLRYIVLCCIMLFYVVLLSPTVDKMFSVLKTMFERWFVMYDIVYMLIMLYLNVNK